jgi:hypothetical protein
MPTWIDLECKTRLFSVVNGQKMCENCWQLHKKRAILELSYVLGFVNQSVKDIVAEIYHSNNNKRLR